MRSDHPQPYSVLVLRVDEVFGNDVRAHLESRHVGVKFAAHALAAEVAGGTQMARYHAPAFTKRH